MLDVFTDKAHPETSLRVPPPQVTEQFDFGSNINFVQVGGQGMSFSQLTSLVRMALSIFPPVPLQL